MVEPLTIIIAITSLFSLLSSGINWIKNRAHSQSAPLSIAAQTHPAAILPPEDVPKLEYESSKQKKETLASYESDDRKSSSNTGFPIGVIFIIAFILGVMGFIAYRKHIKLKENQFNFRQTRKHVESPPSPRTTQTDFNLTVV